MTLGKLYWDVKNGRVANAARVNPADDPATGAGYTKEPYQMILGDSIRVEVGVGL